ncbi:hypothetical protein OQA88_5358 [Cercophora sp. LCS_1]
MSPCEVIVPPPKQAHVAVDIDQLLREFDVSSNGFLPESPPLRHIDDPYYAPWESLISEMPSALKSGTFRSKVDALPILSTTDLTTILPQRRAYVLLTFFTHAYIWGGPTPSETLPPQITLPLLSISNTLSLPPVATYASLNLYNYTTPDPNNLDTIASLHTFTDTVSESWFYSVSIAIESIGARLIPSLISSLFAARRRDFASVVPALQNFIRRIHELGLLLERMDERCDPNVFYHQIRPFLAGSKNMETAGLPNGVFYDEGDGRGTWRRLRGGSNGQSSLIQLFDLVLGVEHGAGGGFHEEVRGYMPKRHREFLEWVGESFPGGLRALLDGECGDVFSEATRALAEFRGRHLRMVARYIVIPAQMGRAGKGVRNLATDRGELTGTGGTALLPFLKESRDETLRAGLV